MTINATGAPGASRSGAGRCRKCGGALWPRDGRLCIVCAGELAIARAECAEPVTSRHVTCPRGHVFDRAAAKSRTSPDEDGAQYRCLCGWVYEDDLLPYKGDTT